MLDKKAVSAFFRKRKKLIGTFIVNRKHVAAWIIFCTFLSLAIVLSDTCVCYAVSLNGEEIGSLSSRSEIAEAIDSAEAQASAILGEDYIVENKVTVTASIGFSSHDSSDITEKIMENVDGIDRLYAITVDGRPIGISTDEQQLWDIVTGILDDYVTEATTSVSFLEDVSVSHMFVNEDLETDVEKISEMLDPENDSSPYSLTVVSYDLVESSESIPYETQYVYDDMSFEDEQSTVTEGVAGVSAVYTQYTVLNGKRIASAVTDTSVVAEPVAEVISIGTKEGSRTDSTGTYILPADGIFTSYFGYRSGSIGSSNHKGVDIANDAGTSICAADGGTVILSEWVTGYGNLIKIQHDNGDVTYYAHLSEALVEVGQKVAQGDEIALMGSTGVSSGPHLHFELRLGGETHVDPLDHIEI